MRILVIGCNHRSAPVEVRERIAFDEPAVQRALAALKAQYPQSEAVVISTCNRMELYVARPVQGQPRIRDVIDFIATFHGVEPADFAGNLYSYEDTEAVRHLFRVVSSLDSMVVGETQILGQAKAALESAHAAGSVGKRLTDLFQRAFAVAKTVQTSTGIASGRLSVGSTAVDLARQIFSHFDDKHVLMVGAGKMGELTLTHLLSTKPRRLWVTNRTDARAVELAERISARHGIATQVIPFAAWIDRLVDMDIVISSTGAREPILDRASFAPIPKRRDYRPLLLIDIAVPRDIDPAVGEHDGVFLYNIDDLQSVTEVNLAQRREAIGRCHEIIEAGLVEYAQAQARRDVGPLVAALRRHFHEVGRGELERLLPKLGTLPARDRELIEQMLHRTMQKLLHKPIHLLNDRADNGAVNIYADALRVLFDLSETESDGPG